MTARAEISTLNKIHPRRHQGRISDRYPLGAGLPGSVKSVAPDRAALGGFVRRRCSPWKPFGSPLIGYMHFNS